MAKVTKEFDFITPITRKSIQGRTAHVMNARLIGECNLFDGSGGNGPSYSGSVSRIFFDEIEVTEQLLALRIYPMDIYAIKEAVYGHCFKIYEEHYLGTLPATLDIKEDRADELRERQYENQFSEPVNHDF